METKEPSDFETFKQEAIKGLYAGQSINGEWTSDGRIPVPALVGGPDGQVQASSPLCQNSF